MFELMAVGVEAKIFWADLQYIGTTTLPLLWLEVVLIYTGGTAGCRRRCGRPLGGVRRHRPHRVREPGAPRPRPSGGGHARLADRPQPRLRPALALRLGPVGLRPLRRHRPRAPARHGPRATHLRAAVRGAARGDGGAAGRRLAVHVRRLALARLQPGDGGDQHLGRAHGLRAVPLPPLRHRAAGPRRRDRRARRRPRRRGSRGPAARLQRRRPPGLPGARATTPSAGRWTRCWPSTRPCSRVCGARPRSVSGDERTPGDGLVRADVSVAVPGDDGGSQRDFTLHLTPVRSHGGEVVGHALLLHDVSESVELLARLERLASRDELTGLLSRKAWQERGRARAHAGASLRLWPRASRCSTWTSCGS